MDKLISVIIPVYNVEKYLNRCIESVVNQTYKNLEIILVDDGSTDNSSKICDIWKDKDTRIKVFHQTNCGPGIARNNGIKIAKGDYYAFPDSDDFLDLSAYKKMMDLLEKENADMAICGMVYVYDDKYLRLNEVNLPKSKASNILEYFTLSGKYTKNNEIITDNIMGSVSRSIFKRDLVNENRFVNMSLSEDLFFNIDIITPNTKIAVVNEGLYFYYQRSNSLLHTFDEKKYKLRIDFTNKVLSKLKKRIKEEYYNAYKFHLYCLILNDIALSNNMFLYDLFKQDPLFKTLNTKQNYKAKQTQTRNFKYKLANFLAYKKLFKIYSFFVKKLKK